MRVSFHRASAEAQREVEQLDGARSQGGSSAQLPARRRVLSEPPAHRFEVG